MEILRSVNNWWHKELFVYCVIKYMHYIKHFILDI